MIPPVFTIEEFEKTFKVSHSKAYQEINSGRLQTYNVGRRRYVSGRAAEAWQQGYEALSNASKPPVK